MLFRSRLVVVIANGVLQQIRVYLIGFHAKVKFIRSEAKGLLFALSFLSRGLPSLFIYVVVAAGQDPGRAEIFFIDLKKGTLLTTRGAETLALQFTLLTQL